MKEVYFDDDGNPTAADWRTPDKVLEPEEPNERETPSTITIIERIASTFTTGDSRITALAWRYILGDESESMRRSAKRAGVSTAAISKRARVLAKTFGMPLRNPHNRDQRREITRASWRKQKRRAGLPDPPPRMNAERCEPLEPGGPHE